MSVGARNLMCNRSGSLVLLVQAASDPTVAEWETFLDTASEAMAENGGQCRVLVITAGGKPDSELRARSLERGWRDNPASPVVVITEDRLALGAITVFSWFGLNIRAFKGKQLDAAYARLELTSVERRWVDVERRVLEQRLKLGSADAS
jgi:DNA-binding LacI/PurR family transcriptional regulator